MRLAPDGLDETWILCGEPRISDLGTPGWLGGSAFMWEKMRGEFCFDGGEAGRWVWTGTLGPQGLPTGLPTSTV